MLIIGSHVSFGKNQLLGSVKEAISYGSNTFMFYTGAPQNTIRKDIDINLTNTAIKLMKDNNINLDNVICHAPYIVNPASNDPIKSDFAISFIKQELSRCNDIGIKNMVLHPGSAVNETRQEGLDNIINSLNYILDNNYNVNVLLETMAGKGNECGITTDELAYIINNVKDNSKLGVCIDTCHLSDSGVDLAKFDEYLDDFDKKIGINKIKCIHVNDSKNIIGSHKDRHEIIGYGKIGFNNILNVVYNARLESIPKILETPYIGESLDDKNKIYPPYKYEIEMIKNKVFNENLIEDIKNQY